MREIRQSGSEGGVAFGPSLPLSFAHAATTLPNRYRRKRMGEDVPRSWASPEGEEIES